ncbi:MAG: VOC family protein [Sphingomonadaceae bacterium]
MISIRAIDHVVFRVRDLAAAKAFYIDVLGASVDRVRDEIGLHQLRIGDALIDLVPIDGALGRQGGGEPDHARPNVDHVCFRVTPWDEAAIRSHLARHGIAPIEIVSRYGAEGYGPSIYLQDPEGNRIELKGPPSGT